MRLGPIDYTGSVQGVLEPVGAVVFLACARPER